MAVYFATAGDYLKIGYSHDPIKRANTITSRGTRPDDLPENTPVRLLGWIPGNRQDEADLHRDFWEDRVKGEWFRCHDVESIRQLIWSDPAGIDCQRMPAVTVFYAADNPDVTRDELEAVGFSLEATPIREAMDRIAAMLSGGAA